MSGRNPGKVERPSMSFVVSPASTIAFNDASMVSSRPDCSSLRPTADWPIPLMTTSGAGICLSLFRNHLGDILTVSQRRVRSMRSHHIYDPATDDPAARSEEHTSELQSLMRISYAVFCLKKKNKTHQKQQKYDKETL